MLEKNGKWSVVGFSNDKIVMRAVIMANVWKPNLYPHFWQMPCTHPSRLALLQKKFFCSYRANNSERGRALIWLCVHMNVHVHWLKLYL